MIEAYLSLVNRIYGELDDLDKVIARSEKAVEFSRKFPQDQDLYMDSAALNLHGFYSGIERLLHQIAAIVDNEVPAGANWHRELLHQMGRELTEVRPAIFSETTIEKLDEYLRFRHVVRNLYTFSFIPEQIDRLVKQARPLFIQIKSELLIFIEFLEQVGK